MAQVLDILVGRKKFPIASICLAEFSKRICGFGSGKNHQIRSVEHSVLVLQQERPYFVAWLEHEIWYASRHINGEIRVTIKPPGDVIDVGLHTAKMCANSTQLRILFQQVITRRED